jgi:hypothetical protein
LALFFTFACIGVYLIHDSLHDIGPYADSGVLAGAMFFAFALAAMSWAIRQHLLNKALQRHFRRRHNSICLLPTAHTLFAQFHP